MLKLKIINLNLSKQGSYATLKEFVRLVRLLTNLHTCVLTFVDFQENKVSKIACSSENKDFEEFLEKKRKIELVSSGEIGVSLEIALNGLPYETNTLQKKGGGVSNPEISKQFGIKSFYCYPIYINKKLKGYLNFFSVEPENAFSDELKQLIELFANFAEIPVHQHEIYKKYNRD